MIKLKNTEIYFQEFLPNRYFEEISDLFFFNSFQSQYRKGIVSAIEKFGMPSMLEDEIGVRIQLNGYDWGQQTLFVTIGSKVGPLVAIVINVIIGDTLSVVHFVVNKQYFEKELGRYEYSLFILSKLAQMMKPIKEIKFVKFEYTGLILPLKKLEILFND